MTDMKESDLTAYHKWLLEKSQSFTDERFPQREILGLLIHLECVTRNPQAFELAEMTGDKTYTNETFLKCADMLLNAQ